MSQANPAVNFEALLGTKLDTVEKPKVMPMGTYSFVIIDHEFGTSAQKGTPFVQFNTHPRVAQDDVDEELLSEVKNWQDRKMKVTYYLTEDSLFRLKDFLEHCQIDITGRTIAECIPETTGQMFNGYVKQQSAPNGTDMYANIDQTSAVE
jgi:hypothetical protein